MDTVSEPTVVDDDSDLQVVAESKWPVIIAVIVATALSFVVPEHDRYRHGWVLVTLELLFIAIIVIGDPGAIDRRSRSLRSAAVGLVSLLAVASFAGTAYLVTVLITGGDETETALQLLAAGCSVWASNTIVFALLYWVVDGGGAAARAHRLELPPSFLFPEYEHPELVAPNWRPVFFDYLHVALTNSTAFSPTDVLPLQMWSKYAMTAQAYISLSIIGLVVARAVNVLP